MGRGGYEERCLRLTRKIKRVAVTEPENTREHRVLSKGRGGPSGKPKKRKTIFPWLKGIRGGSKKKTIENLTKAKKKKKIERVLIRKPSILR